MIIVIAPESDVPNEIETLTMLFQEGLQNYHLRKPNKSYEEHCDYLNQIDKQYHDRIVVHYFHDLMNKFNLKGLHFQEQKRRDCLANFDNYLAAFNLEGKTISSSFHDTQELADCEIPFDYHLLSPVFTSISKEGYEGKGFDVNLIPKLIVGMGGITPTTLLETFKLGYKGVGILGGIWNDSNPVATFIKIETIYNSLKS